MKNKLFLVALATITVLGLFLATPHHQTVHAAEQTVTKKTATETCTLDGKICYGYEISMKTTPIAWFNLSLKSKVSSVGFGHK